MVEATPERVEDGTATGFTFVAMTATAFLATVERALALYTSQPDRWLSLR